MLFQRARSTELGTTINRTNNFWMKAINVVLYVNWTIEHTFRTKLLTLVVRNFRSVMSTKTEENLNKQRRKVEEHNFIPTENVIWIDVICVDVHYSFKERDDWLDRLQYFVSAWITLHANRMAWMSSSFLSTRTGVQPQLQHFLLKRNYCMCSSYYCTVVYCY